MELNRDEIKYVIDLLETDIFVRNGTIRKVLDNPDRFIDNVSELKRRNAFAREIIAKLQSR